MTAWILLPYIEFLASKWVSYAILAACVLLALLALAVAGLCILGGWFGLRRKQQAAYSMQLGSESNLETAFELKVNLDGLEKKVIPFWLQDGRKLVPKTIKHYSYVEEVLPAPVPAKKPFLKKKSSKAQDQVKEGYQKVNGIANLVANISGALASLLPGSLKKPFRAINDSIRQEQKSVSRVKGEADRVKSTTRSLDSNVKRLGKTTGVNPAVKSEGEANSEKERGRRLVVSEVKMVETQAFQPGQTSTLTLILRPRNPLKLLVGKFLLTSRPVEVKEFPIYGRDPAQTLSGEVNIRRLPTIYLFLFAAFCAGALALNAWWGLLSIQWLLQFR